MERRVTDRLVELLDSAGEGLYSIDLEGRCTFINAAGARLLGYAAEELVGRNMHRLVHHTRADGTPYPEAECPVYQAFLGERGCRVDRDIFWRRDGTSFPVSYASHPLRVEGRTVGAVVNFQDTSARVAAERALRESELRYRLVTDTASDVIVTIDEQSTVLFVSAAVRRVFGYAPEEVIGKHLTMLMPESLREAHRRGLTRYLETGRRNIPWHAVRLPGLHRDGREVPLEVSFGESVLEGRRAITGVMRDVSDRVRAERRQAAQFAVARILAEETSLHHAVRRILRAICENLGWDLGVVWVLERQRGVLRCLETWSPPAAPLPALERASHEIVLGPGEGLPGRVWVDRQAVLVQELTADRNFLRHDAAVADGVRSGVAFPIALGDEVVGVMEFFSREARAPDPELMSALEPLGVQIGQFVDRMRAEDERRRLFLLAQAAEEQLREYSLTLEQRVAERTAALQETNTQLEAFSYSVAHDLRAPLRAIQGYTEAILDEYGRTLDQTAHDWGRRIVAAVRRMDRLILDLLAFSRLGRSALPLAPTPLGAVVQEALAQLESDLHERGAVVRLELPDDLPRVVGHHGTLVQVFSNLLSNAAKFVAAGITPEIAVGGSARGGVVRAWVRDNGLGIAPEYHERIFGVFERLHGGDQYGGTGVGLAIVRRAVERMGGAVGVESESDRGSTFWVELPAERVRTRAKAPAARAKRSAGGG